VTTARDGRPAGRPDGDGRHGHGRDEAAPASAGAVTEAGLRRLAGAGVVGIILADFAGRVLDANTEFLAMLGYTREDLASGRLRWDELTPPEWRGVDEAIMRTLEAAGEARPLEKEFVHRDGRRVPVLVGGALLSREGTETVAFVVDLTRQRRAEAEVAVREALFRHTFEQAAVGMAHVGLDGRWLRINDRLAEILGYAPAELLARTFQDVTAPEDLAADQAHVAALLRGEAARYAMDKRYLRRDGTPVWVRLTVSLVRDAEGRPDYFISVVEDIDARKRAEAENARYAAMLAHITDGVVAFEGAELRVTYLNAEAERLWRRPAAEIRGRPLLDVSPELADSLGYRETRRAVVEQRPVRYEEFHAPHGVWYEAQVYPTPPVAEPGREPAPAGALTIYRDVTARRTAAARAEEARAQAEAASRAKSDFLAAMSHELRTPINAIQGYVDLIDLGLAGPLTEEQRAYLARTRLAARTLLTVVNDVLDLSKIEAGKVAVDRRAARAAAAVEAAVALVQPQALAKGVAVVGACAGDLAYWGDEARVQQIVTNLVANAVKFTPAGGRVTVLCGAADQPPAGATVSVPRVGAGGWMVIRVQDTGVGIAPDALGRVFEAFEQAESGYRRAHGGTGLGLTISRHLARLMGGDVAAESVVGEGSSFFLVLPAAPAGARAGAPDSAERRGAARYVRGLGLVGDAALGEVERILAAYGERLRADPGTPSARALTAAELSDHTATFLADLAQTLALIEAARGGPSDTLRDGTAIQRLVSERHGALRARLGWDVAELRREFQILREEVEAAVRRRVTDLAAADPDAPERTAPVDEALALLARFADHAERASVDGFERAAAPAEATSERRAKNGVGRD
jgi:PAS domain S-box-containing protein